LPLPAAAVALPKGIAVVGSFAVFFGQSNYARSDQ
jgi:hypothetical protein